MSHRQLFVAIGFARCRGIVACSLAARRPCRSSARTYRWVLTGGHDGRHHPGAIMARLRGPDGRPSRKEHMGTHVGKADDAFVFTAESGRTIRRGSPRAAVIYQHTSSDADQASPQRWTRRRRQPSKRTPKAAAAAEPAARSELMARGLWHSTVNRPRPDRPRGR